MAEDIEDQIRNLRAGAGVASIRGLESRLVQVLQTLDSE